MKKVNARTADVRAKVEKNLLDHLDEYRAACRGYKSKAIAYLQSRIEEIRKQISKLEAGEVFAVGLADTPVSHEADYKQAIEMLKLEQEPVITLEQDDVARLIMDNWTWKDHFLRSTSNYK